LLWGNRLSLKAARFILTVNGSLAKNAVVISIILRNK